MAVAAVSTWCVSNILPGVMGGMITDYLVKPVERFVCTLFTFNQSVEDLHKQMENFKIIERNMLQSVEDAGRQISTMMIHQPVTEWIEEAKNVLKEAQRLENRTKENERFFRCFPNWRWRYQVIEEIQNTTSKITDLVNRSKSINGNVGGPALLPDIELMPSEGLVVSESSTAAFKKIMEALKDDKVSMIGLWGMGGVGKTTLVTQVGNKAKESELFNKVIVAVVSQTPDIEKVQNKIADSLDFKFEKNTKEEKAKELWAKLEKEEKVLIILDDMWKELDLIKDIGIPFAAGNDKGCKFILTTRKYCVCRSMKCQVTVPLDVFKQGEAWDLFKKHASLDDIVSDRKIVAVAEEVSKECEGLPIALVPLATALKDKDLNVWESALENLQKSRLMEIENIEDEREKNAYTSLKISYDHLRTDPIKRCFLVCALFPEDYLIDVEEELVQYAWGLMLYPNANTSIEKMRREVLVAIDILKDSSLILADEKAGYIKVHDMIRDVARWIASKEKNGFLTEPEIGSQNLEILLLKNYGDEDDTDTPLISFEGMQQLKVLSLNMVSIYQGFSFTALESLQNLRVLHVENCFHLKDISALAKLTKLEILTLHQSTINIEEFADEVGELKNLRVLDLRRCSFFLKVAPNLIQKLVHLEELFMDKGCGKGYYAILPKLNTLSKLTSLFLEVSSHDFPEGFVFPELQRYQIAINTGVPEASSSRSLTIKSWDSPTVNAISKLLSKAEFLEVVQMDHIKCLIDTTPQNVGVDLKLLKVWGCKNLQVIFRMVKVETEAPLISKLEDIHLQDLPNLEYIWKLPIRYHIRLQSLKAVKISNCGQLKSVFSFSVAQSLVLLEELTIQACEELEQVVEELTEGINSHTNPADLCLPKMKSLEISDCKILIYIFPKFMSPKGLLQLKVLVMERLPQLKQIFRAAIAKQRDNLEDGIAILPNLMRLNLRDCPELIHSTIHLEAINAKFDENVRLSKLSEAFNINSTKVLHLERIGDHNLIPEGTREGLNELTSLELDSCDSLEYLVDTTKEHVPNSAFSTLEELSLKRMPGLKIFCNGQSPEGFLKNVKKLTVEYCDKLQEIFQMDKLLSSEDLSNLEHLSLTLVPELRWILKGPPCFVSLQICLKVVVIYQCQKLEYLFSPSLIQSLALLEALQVAACDEFKTLFSEMESDGETKSCSSYTQPLQLPKLTTLYISGCRRLERVLPSNNAYSLYSLPKLRTLSISNCEILEYALPITLAEGLPELQSAEVLNCPQLKQVIGATKEHYGVDYSIELSCLKTLKLESLTNLSSFGPENYYFKTPALERLDVSGTPLLTKFAFQQEVNTRVHLELSQAVQFSNVVKDLSSNIKSIYLNGCMIEQKSLNASEESRGLASLGLRNCKDVECLVDTTSEHVPKSGIFTDLVELFLYDLKDLKMLYYGQTPKDFLQNLKILKVGGCYQLQEILGVNKREENGATQLLSNLQQLELKYLRELRWILRGPSHYFNLRSLMVISIVSCQELEYLFSTSLIPGLRLLKALNIEGCDHLESVFLDDQLDSDDDDQIKSKTLALMCLPNLKTMQIINCHRLKYVFPTALAEGGLPLLKRITLWELKNLCGLIAKNYFLKLPALKNLRVSACPQSIKFTIEAEVNKPIPLELQDYGVFISNLLTIKLENLIWLQDIWSVCIQDVTNLRKLMVYKCNELAYIFPLMLIPNLPQLEFLGVQYCRNVVQIIAHDSPSASEYPHHHLEETMAFPRLKQISLLNLPSFVSFNPEGYHLVFPYLVLLDIIQCPKMITKFWVDESDTTMTMHATEAPSLVERETTQDIRWAVESFADRYYGWDI